MNSENQNTEWKSEWQDKYLEWVCGFANAQGGEILLGKNDNAEITGIKNARKLLEDIPNKAKNLLGIIVDVHLYQNSGKDLITITIPSYSVPISYKGKYYYRSGSTKKELTGQALTEFLLKKMGQTWDELPEERAKLTDIDEASIRKYVTDVKGSGRFPALDELKTHELLDKLNLLEGGAVKRAAIVLFGKNPERFYPNMAVKLGRFGQDAGDLITQDLIEGNLIEVLDQTIETLRSKYLKFEISYKGIQRIERPEYPIEALREILLNALIHRSYMGSNTLVRIFDDHIHVWNDGPRPVLRPATSTLGEGESCKSSSIQRVMDSSHLSFVSMQGDSRFF